MRKTLKIRRFAGGESGNAKTIAEPLMRWGQPWASTPVAACYAIIAQHWPQLEAAA